MADPHALADRLYPALAKQIRAVLNALRDSTDIDALQVPPEIRDAVRDVLSRVAAATATPTAAGFGVNFNSVNPAVVSWAERYTGQLITQITEETRQAIRDVIAESLRQGTGPAPTARDLRQYIGLNGPQARALARFEASFETPSPKLVERRAARMLRERATMIARTELITASNQGQQLMWNHVGDHSLIPETAYKEWLATDDERTCQICNNMNGTRVPYRSEYLVATKFDGSGGALNVEPKMVPPAHPMCRCAMVLVNLDGELGTAPVEPSTTEPEAPPQVTPDDGFLTDEQWDAMDPDAAARYETRHENALAAMNATPEGKTFREAADTWISGTRSLKNIKDQIGRIVQGLKPEGTAGDRASALLNYLRGNRYPPPDRLYRGMRIKGSNPQKILDDLFSPGSTHDITLSSFTKERKVANFYATYLRPKGQTPVIIDWVGPKQAAPIQNLAPKRDWFNDREWIAGGRFEVIEAKVYAGEVRVTVQQVAGL